MRSFAALIFLSLSAFLISRTAPPERVGPTADGGFLLGSGWRLKPAGKHTRLDTFPMASAVSPGGRYLVVMNAGYLPPSLSVIDARSRQEISRTPVADAWLGLAFNTAGDRVYAGGGSQACIFEFEFRKGRLRQTRTFRLGERGEPKDFTGDVAISPDGRTLYAAQLYRDAILAIDISSGGTAGRFVCGTRPYRIRFSPDGKMFAVSGWADSKVRFFRVPDGEPQGIVETGPHPTDMLFAGDRLFVAAANTNNVDVIRGGRVVERINIALTPRQPVGMTPSALALSPDGTRLYVACSDANALAVVDVSGEESRVLGFIPTGWYPTAVEALGDGRLAVVSGRGLRSLANPNGPNPKLSDAPLHEGDPEPEYIARLHTGAISFIDPFDPMRLDEYTSTVMAGCPYSDSKLDDAGVPKGNPVPSRPGDTSPIRHVLYVIKENRTYDQVLGDLKQGDGDSSLTLFGEKVTPNQHKLAREFVLFDNFYVNAEVSADGHNWSTAAIAPDYVQKLWPNSYGQRRHEHDYYGPGDLAANAPGGYIWNRIAGAGLSVRNYGYHAYNLVKTGPDGAEVARVGDPVLGTVTCKYFRGFDLDYPEYRRAEAFLKDLARYESEGELPRFMIMHLGRNHTAGTAPGRISPLSMVADNDYALGLIVEGVSNSRFWKDTAIFVLEDDAQNGPDHVDSHRSPAFVISPYAKRGQVDSTMYNTASMLRTTELILGVAPMTHFDAGARPMAGAFQSSADARPFSAEKPRISLETRNPGGSDTAARSERLNFEDADRADEDELNDILWRAVKGTESPAPVRSWFAKQGRNR